MIYKHLSTVPARLFSKTKRVSAHTRAVIKAAIVKPTANSARPLPFKLQYYITTLLISLLNEVNNLAQTRLINLDPANIRFNATTRSLELISSDIPNVDLIKHNLKSRFGVKVFDADSEYNNHQYNLWQAYFFILELIGFSRAQIKKAVENKKELRLSNKNVFKILKQERINSLNNLLKAIKAQASYAVNDKNNVTPLPFGMRTIHTRLGIAPLSENSKSLAKALTTDISFDKTFEAYNQALSGQANHSWQDHSIPAPQNQTVQDIKSILGLISENLLQLPWSDYGSFKLKILLLKAIQSKAEKYCKDCCEATLLSIQESIAKLAARGAERTGIGIWQWLLDPTGKTQELLKVLASWDSQNSQYVCTTLTNLLKKNTSEKSVPPYSAFTHHVSEANPELPEAVEEVAGAAEISAVTPSLKITH